MKGHVKGVAMNGTPESQMSEFAPDVIALIGTGAAKVIPLTQGKVTVVDAEDYEWLSQWKWQAQRDNHTYYAIRSIRINKDRKHGLIHLKMHRELLGLVKGDGKIGDHIDRNGLHNCRRNLRTVNSCLSAYNHRLHPRNTSGYRGVSFCSGRGKWIVHIGCNGNFIYLGAFSDAISAAKAYDKAAINYWEANAMLNFPEKRA